MRDDVTLAELDALRVQILVLEQRLIEQRARAERAEANHEYALKGRALDEALRRAAEAAGVDVTTWELDLGTRVWRRKGAPQAESLDSNAAPAAQGGREE